MDKKITELKEIENLTGVEYLVVASEEDVENYKIRVSDFAGEAIGIDTQLSETSENPVQNKVITQSINELEDRIEEIEQVTGKVVDINVSEVDTITIDPSEDAKVEVIDLGTDETDTKNLAFKFYIPKGDTGQPGQVGVQGVATRTVFAFKSSETKPNKPVGGSWDVNSNEVTYPTEWSPTDTLEPPIWMSNATFDENGIVSDWSDPIQITGEKGVAGADGVNIEFIYRTAKDETEKIDTPYSDPNVTDYVPNNWLDHPSGVSETVMCEYVCTRTKDDVTNKWGAWNGPVLWAKYGANGKDGDGVEYIYQRTTTEKSPKTPGKTAAAHSPVTNYQDREFIPEAASGEYDWTDNPSGTSNSFLCEWVCTRKWNWETQLWGDWSAPTLWSKYGKDSVPTFTSIVFCRTNHTPAAPDSSDGNYSSPVPSEQIKNTSGTALGIYWSDGIPSGEERIWSTQRIFSQNGEWPQTANWSTPTQMSDTVSYDVEFSPNEIRPAAPSDNISERPAQGWYDPTTNSSFDFSTAVWRAERQKKNGEWTEWVIYKVKGENGIDGKDGTSINIYGSYDSEVALNTAHQNGTLFGNNPPQLGDAYVVSGYLYVWDGSKFVNCGQFKGDKGDKGDQGEPGSPGADGLPGQQGCILRYAEWAIDIEWRNDEEITENVTRYLDCALIKNPESTTGWDAYKCIKTHISSVDTMPSVSGGSEYWEPFGLNVPAVFTNVILAKNAHIDLMQGNDILVKKSDASVTAGMSGSDEGEKIRFWAGDTAENKENAPYQVDENGVVTSTMFRTGKTGMRMECFSGLIQFFNADGFKNIEFGVNAAGMATMSYYDNNGNLLYDLGPEGITKINMSEEKWTPYYLRNLGTSVETILDEKQYKNRTYSEDYLVYQYKSKVVAGVVDKPDYDNKFFTNIVKGAPEDATLVADGYYQSMPSQSSANNTFGEIRISNYDGRLLTSADLPNLNIYNEPVYATAPVYTFGFQYISNGKYSSKQFTAYWNG